MQVGCDESVVTEHRGDDELTAAELVEVLAHCKSFAAAAEYRMLMAASRIHQQREEEYQSEVAELRGESCESTSMIDLAERVARARAGTGAREAFGPDGLERAIADVGAILTITPAQARQKIIAGDGLRYRLAFTGHALACGRIDARRFEICLKRTELVSAEHIHDVDVHLAEAIFDRPPMSTTRFTVMVDAIIAEFDPGAMRRRRERAEDDRNIIVGSDRFAPGQSRVSGSLPLADAAALNARLAHMAAEVHAADPRTRAQRRADALLALAAGSTHLDCTCSECVRTPPDICAPPDTDPGAGGRAVEPGVPAIQPTFHIVVNLSTLVGLDDRPGFLDGQGVIDAETARALLFEAKRSYVAFDALSDRDAADRARRTYAPNRRLQALVRSGELCCSFPGCNNPVWTVDLDHSEPFNHEDPGRGGPTDARNLEPLCRFHHRIKTFGFWQDYQDEFQRAWFTSPTGHIFLGNAYNGRDLFGNAVPPVPEHHPARRRLTALREREVRRKNREVERWNQQNPPPF
ncbi:DUF222 domain-containing protein [Gordonia sp. ABSL1-1]|uniref:HNH endonuclease signature motif containing protein n=1 Tax=Gordonia sp. ABSL1-1 TaxID=3053923 RepID=UPI0025727C3B|nr:HNH endonuclease signature motif containing protein [Gordonia sp. ABSL1-1]MDL9936940.1 DUF222 domain-containing protein [Gordonia sp. ABSL1-1]